MSSCFLSVCLFVIRLSIHPVAPKASRELWVYLKENMYSTLACTSPFSSAYPLLCCAAPHFCFLSPYNTHMHPHSLSFRSVAPSSERLFGTEHFFPGSVLVSKTTWEAVHNGSVALPSSHRVHLVKNVWLVEFITTASLEELSTSTFYLISPLLLRSALRSGQSRSLPLPIPPGWKCPPFSPARRCPGSGR